MSQRDAMLLALAELVPEDAVPEVLVDAETNERLHDLGHRLSQQQMSLEIVSAGHQPDARTNCSRRCARTPFARVRVDLALRALVGAEHLEPTQEEIDEELETHRRWR